MEWYGKKAIIVGLYGTMAGFSNRGIEKALRYWSQVARSGVVIVDLYKVNSWDSLGLELLRNIALLENVVLCAAPGDVERQLDGATTTRPFPLYKSVSEAVGNLNLEIHRPYLMYGERRGAPRSDIFIATKFKVEKNGQFVAFSGIINNISEGGVLIEYIDQAPSVLPVTLAPHMHLKAIRIEIMQNVFFLDGAIARLSSDNFQMGIGVRFENVRVDQKEHIHNYITNRHNQQVVARLHVANN
jgi:hypothetical protein